MHGEFTHWIFIAAAAIVLHYFLLLPSSSLSHVLSNDKGKQKFCTHLIMDKLAGKGSCCQVFKSQLALGRVGVELKFEPFVHF